MVGEAQSPCAVGQWVDRFALIYTPAIWLRDLVAAVPPLVWQAAPSEWFYRALISVIGCPCVGYFDARQHLQPCCCGAHGVS
jgi:cation transport ATPase